MCFGRNILYLQNQSDSVMRIFTEKSLKLYADLHPEAKTALQDWIKKVKQAQWKSYNDIKQTFNSVDYVGNQRYVFLISGEMIIAWW